MHVVVHNDEAIDNHSLIFYKELHATGDNVFIFIWFKNQLPFKVGSGKELRISGNEGRHSLKLREVVFISVVGDAGAHKLRHNTNNGVKAVCLRVL
jgi:Flp pilus assembly CpaE family ATPase